MKKNIVLLVAITAICSVQTASAWGGWTHKLIAHTALHTC